MTEKFPPKQCQHQTTDPRSPENPKEDRCLLKTYSRHVIFKIIYVQISSILAWRIPWTEEAGGLTGTKSGSQRVRHD